MRKLVIGVIAVFILITTGIFCYFFIGTVKPNNSVTWGVDFSQSYATSLGLDWKQAYQAMFTDLRVKHVKLHLRWDAIESKAGGYDFSHVDWQLATAKQYGADAILVLGLKSGRWPECHMPAYAADLDRESQQQAILDYVAAAVERYKDNETVIYWQAENEPFFRFGECPGWYYQDKTFLPKEVALIKSIDSTRKVIVSDSGEASLWWRAAQTGDIVGATMYRESWIHISDGIGLYFHYFFSPVYYHRKAMLVQWLFGKKTICIELQAEPWTNAGILSTSLEEQEKTMNLQTFKDNIQYAKDSGFDTVYLWGEEWWYWMKVTQERPEIWEAAKSVF